MDKLTLFLAITALVIAMLNAIDLHLLRGKLKAQKTIAVEGYATAAAVQAATGLPVAVAPDPWTDPVQQWLATAPQVPLTTDTILANALPGTAATRQASARITAVMKALGYRATRVRLPGQETLTRVFQPLPGTVVELQP